MKNVSVVRRTPRRINRIRNATLVSELLKGKSCIRSVTFIVIFVLRNGYVPVDWQRICKNKVYQRKRSKIGSQLEEFAYRHDAQYHTNMEIVQEIFSEALLSEACGCKMYFRA